ncbi:MAG TPA: hypothetical protein VIT91_08410 [Chthoniobacterales bacterium]
MNARFVKLQSCVLAVGLATAGCAEMTPGENAGVFGGLAGVGAGIIAKASGASTSDAIAVGAATGVAVGAITYIVAKHQATERQRAIAEARAARAYRAMPPQRKAALKEKKVRYIAVDTERNEQSKGKKSVMVWDTQSQEVVGNNVYDVEKAPSVGSTAKFDAYNAQYVGTGA